MAAAAAWQLRGRGSACRSGAVVAAYNRYDFRAVSQLLFDFCNETLSATYLAAITNPNPELETPRPAAATEHS